jgi:hypothetical protein
MESPIIILIIALIVYIIAIVLFIIVKPTGSSPGKKCTTTSECQTGLQCTGVCSVPKYASCSYSPDNCITGTVCNKGRCVVVITENIIGLPDSGVGPSLKPVNPDTISETSSDNDNISDLNNTMAIEEGNIIEAPIHTLYFSETFESNNPQKIYTGHIISATYHNNKIYFITTTPNIIYVYDINNKKLITSLTHNFGQLEDLESTIFGDFYTRKGTSIYTSTISSVIYWNRLQINNVDVSAKGLTTDPIEENVYFLDQNNLHKIYTDDPTITLILNENNVMIYTNNILTETITRPDGKFPLYQHGTLSWTLYEYRYFINNTIYKYIFIK